LKAYITYLLQYNPNILLIGEAPGYRGCRLTGIPFTSGEVIKNSKHTIFKELGSEIVPPQIISENTATILWEFLGSTKSVPILWNAFPFHPHQSDNPESNRKPDVSEIKEGETYLRIIYDLFKPRKLCSLGRVGESILKELFPKNTTTYIRHPSYGGKEKFIKGMNKVYSHVS
jgi:uracil-DNA glycosylase